MLRYDAFDPLLAEPAVPSALAAPASTTLFLVQFVATPTQADRDALRRAGADVRWYAPHDGYVVRGGDRTQLAQLANVRWVGAFQPAWKLEPSLSRALLADALEPDRYVLVMVDPQRDEPALLDAVQAVGGELWRRAGGNLLIEANLTPAQLQALAAEDTVLWIQRSEAPEIDMDNARIQGGANTIEALGNHTGKGVRGHIMEGIYPNHPEYVANAYRTIPQSVFSGQGSSHGNSTFGINFSAGVNPQARGLCPDGQGYFTDYNYVFNSQPMSTNQNTRYGVVQEITDPASQYRVLYQTASWGYPRTFFYDARSAEMDWIIHQFDIPICQSQSNAGNQDSRPQAWAKNIISVGAVRHMNTADPNDDTQSGTSMGPAQDGRIKPDMCGYYDSIYSTSGSTTYTTSFSGTSGATPIVSGHVGLILEMYTDGYFGHAAAPSWQDRFDYKPHFSTTKALLINTARQYDPAIRGAGAASRYRQGWGFPAVHDLYDLRNNILVLDELDVLQQGESRTYTVFVKPGTPQFRSTMVYSDLAAAAPFSNPHRVNDLRIRVVSPRGTQYHGNTGMANGPSLYTQPGGSPNTLDTVENVFVQNPQSGLWRVEVSAPEVLLDQHVETPAVDADFALVTSGIGAGRDTSGPVLDLQSSAPFDLTISLTNNPASYVDGYLLFSVTTDRPLAMGRFLGLEDDFLSVLSLITPAAVGDPLHFSSTANAGTYPNAPYTFPAGIGQLLQGITLDAVAVYIGAGGNVVAASNVDRVTVQ